MHVPKPVTIPSHPAWASKILSAQRALLSYYLPPPHPSPTELRIPLTNTHDSLNLLKLRSPHAPATAPILLLLHGWGGGLAYFAPLLPHLTPHFHTIYLLDLPGMGASSRTPHPPAQPFRSALDYFLNPLQTVYTHLLRHDATFRDAPARTLVAHSLGAYVAVHWLVQDSPAFDKVVLASPVGLPPRPPPEPRTLSGSLLSWLWRRGVTPQDGLRVLPEGMGRRYCGKYVEKCYVGLGETEQELLAEYVLQNSTARAGGEKACASLLFPGAWAKVPLVDVLEDVKGRVGFVYGERDWMDWRWGEKVARRMGERAWVRRVPKAGHNVFVDNPEAFARACLKGVERVGKANEE